jgi:V/A-type H+-transporting ATPase subunit D
MPRRTFKLTRLELKRQRDALSRFKRYLPMLKLKQQQLQVTLNQTLARLRESREAVAAAEDAFAPSRKLLADLAGVNVRKLASPSQVKTGRVNVAGLELPVYESAEFPSADYSLFGTPPWVDRALQDYRELNRQEARLQIVQRQLEMIRQELTRTIQRVNLFEKVRIPQAQEAIRVIRIALGDEQTAAVVRAKIAKGKLEQTEQQDEGSFAAPRREAGE